MCRNIRTLANFAPPATDDEIRAAALQFVRKLSGTTKPSRRNEAAFNRAVDDVTAAAGEHEPEDDDDQHDRNQADDQTRPATIARCRCLVVDMCAAAEQGSRDGEGPGAQPAPVRRWFGGGGVGRCEVRTPSGRRLGRGRCA
jgi:hypothetical protein